MWGAMPHASACSFMVSGFVMFLPTAARGEFGSASGAIRRSARLFPASTGLAVAAVVLLTVLPTPRRSRARRACSSTSRSSRRRRRMFDGDFALGLDVIPPVWTLSAEAIFYFVLPFIAGCWFRRPFAGLAFAAALMVGWRLLSTIGDVAGAFGVDLGAATVERSDELLRQPVPELGRSAWPAA